MSNKGKLLKRLQKLKALSECRTGNVNETAAAAAAMTRLMQEAGIAQAELAMDDEEEGFSSETIGDAPEDAGWIPPAWQCVLVEGLSKACGCIALVDRWERRIKINGREDDLSRLRYMWDFCTKEIGRLTEAERDRSENEPYPTKLSYDLLLEALYHSIPGIHRGHFNEKEFRLGVATAISHKAIEEVDRFRRDMSRQGRSSSLVKVDTHLATIKRKLEEQMGPMGNAQVRGNGHSQSFREGFRRGHEVQLGGGPALDGEKRRLPPART